MKTSKTLQLIKVLSPKELTAFSKYTQRLETTSELEALKLFHYFKRFAPTFSSNRLHKDLICRHLFPKRIIDNKKLNKIAHQLKELLEDFLVYYDLEQNKILKNHLLVQSLQRRNHPSFAEENRKLADDLQTEQATNLSATNALTLFQLNYGLWSDFNTEKIDSDKQLKRFETAISNLDTFYLQHKLKIIIEYRSLQKIRTIPFTLFEPETIIHLSEQHPALKNNLVITHLLKAITLLDTPKKTIYLDLKLMLVKHIDQLPIADARDIFLVLINYNSSNLSKTPDFSVRESFALFKFADTYQLLVENGRIRAVEYINATKVALSTNHIDWAIAFIEKYKGALNPTIQNKFYLYVRALISYKKSDFNRVLDILNEIQYPEKLTLDIDLPMQTLRLRARLDNFLYKNDDTLKGEIGSILTAVINLKRHIIIHKKLSHHKKKGYTHFLDFFKRLLVLLDSNHIDKNDLLSLSKELEKTPDVTLRSWLQNKIIQVREQENSSSNIANEKSSLDLWSE